MNKELFILNDYMDLKSANFSQLERCDRLAMTADAMLTFEQSGLSYLTFDDFYNYKQFRVDNLKLIQTTENLFSLLDEKYKPFLNFPRIFTGNIYWFLVFFADVSYLSRVCDRISRIYDRIYLVSNSAYKTTFKVNSSFSSDGLIFSKLCMGLDKKVSILRICLFSKCKCIWLNNLDREQFDLNSYKNRFLDRSKYVLKKKISQFKSFIVKDGDKKKKAIFVIQDGYEVFLLKKYMTDFRFINPVDRLFQMASSDRASVINVNPLYSDELEEFAKRWFPKFEKYILELFGFYHNNVICCSNFLSDYINQQFNHYRPSALFYSAGAHTVYEDIYAYIANKNNIPVFYFQHGGTSVFFKHHYQKYVEQNKNIDKTNIYQSKIEKELSTNKDSFKSPALGSIKLYKLYHENKKKRLKKPRRKILYCSSPFVIYAYKDLMENVCDRKIFGINKDVIDVINKFHLNMDIKPARYYEDHYYQYFKDLLRNCNTDSIRVLKGFPIEETIKNYGLLILDYIGSALVPIFVVLDIPVIMYLKDMSCLKKETRFDMEERFYLVKDEADLERYISLYASGRLKSRFSLEQVNRYAFPIKDGDPGILISDFIRTRI